MKLIMNRVLRSLLLEHPEMSLSPEVTEQDIDLFNFLFEKDRRKALAKLGLSALSAEQIGEIEAGDAEIALIQQLKNKALIPILIHHPGPPLWGITPEHVRHLNELHNALDEGDVLTELGVEDIPPVEWTQILLGNARLDCCQELDHWLFNALFARYPDISVNMDELGYLSEQARDAIQRMRNRHEQRVLDRADFEELLDAIGLQHDWLDHPVELPNQPSGSTWWECFETDHARVRAAYCLIDPTLREIIARDPKYVVQEPVDSAVLTKLNQAPSTILRGEYHTLLHTIVSRLIIEPDQFEQVTAFLHAMEYVKKTPFRFKLDYARKEQIEEITEYFVQELTQDVVDITFSALETVLDINTALPKGPLLRFFEWKRGEFIYDPEAEMLKAPKVARVRPTERVIPVPVIPANAAAVIKLSHSAHWEGLLEQTEEAVAMVAERFGWTSAAVETDSTLILYTYSNGLKITYSKYGISYYERNLDDVQLSEELQQKEREFAYAWVELVRPAILVEPVVLKGQSQEMISRLAAEFHARRIATTAGEAETGIAPPKKKGFFQTLTDAARRLDQFGRYLDKGR